MCCDYKKLNAVTIKKKYVMPLIDDIFTSMGYFEYSNSIDLKKGYWQIKLASFEEEEMTDGFCLQMGYLCMDEDAFRNFKCSYDF